MVTMDRFELLRECVGPSLANANYPFELLCTDNASTDFRVVDYLASLQPRYLKRNTTNRGYAPAVNQMLLRSQGEYCCVIDPDILLPNNWLTALVRANQAISNAGISSIHCVMDLPPQQTINGVTVHPSFHAFGIKFFRRDLLDKIGFYSQDYGLYGLEDNEMNHRLNWAGFMNYYVHGFSARHLGDDATANTPYRKMKWDALAKAQPICDANLARIKETKQYYVAPPPLED